MKNIKRIMISSLLLTLPLSALADNDRDYKHHHHKHYHYKHEQPKHHYYKHHYHYHETRGAHCRRGQRSHFRHHEQHVHHHHHHHYRHHERVYVPAVVHPPVVYPQG